MFVEDHLRCSQAVLGAFAEELGLTGELGRKIAGCFGSGMGMGETCGCVTGGLMALGLRFGRSRPEDEAAGNGNRRLPRPLPAGSGNGAAPPPAGRCWAGT